MQFHKAQWKATHNSYNWEKLYSIQHQVREQGVVGLELDIWQGKDEGKYTVSHMAPGNKHHDYAHDLGTYLLDIKALADIRPTIPIILHLDIKNVNQSRFPDLQEFVRNRVDKCWTPKTDQPWPDDPKGWFIPIFTGAHWRKKRGFHTDDRFPDQNLDGIEDHCFVLNISSRRIEKRKALIKSVVNTQRIVRAYGVNSEAAWNRAVDAGVNIISTDHPGAAWATI